MGFIVEKKKLGDMLIAEHIITQDELTEALKEQKTSQKRLGTVLIESGAVTEEQIAKALNKQLGLDLIDLPKYKISKEVIALVRDSTVLKKFTVMPYEIDEYNPNFLRVAMADPLDIVAMDDLEVVTGMQIVPAIATSADIITTIDKYFGGLETQAVADRYAKERGVLGDTDEESEANQAVENSPIVVMVRSLIEQAARQNASDIHIEPLESRIRVRYRVDGVMHEFGSYQSSMQAAIITRIKIIGGMDIAEKRKPQDGRITSIVDRIEYDIRVSVLPTVFGEKVVMRLTSKQALARDKKLLGLSPDDLTKFDKIFANPHGIILVTGPTGSGKSTTLYTALSELNTEDVNIITVEDPVEANIDGINQVQVNVKAEMTFAAALRSILRQDPDIIMIGEIRDQETANIAVTASITGHLVVSTLHTNSAAATITRLADMGIERYLIADATVGVIAQRLVRRLCTCKKSRKATDFEKKLMNISVSEDLTICEPVGCGQCGETGYKGRIGIYEIMPIGYKMRNVIASDATTEGIQKVAEEEGMSTLRNSCIRLIREGVTSMGEMRRIVYGEDDVVSSS